ncbi:protein-S-isoprenylcysteine O-methyltransferase [Planoprotostelium fungivorum]|uniref:Protein-S-isoprenylcysteine O-methyltransferase n=1 Tax=Planoprotostelium fungivorum TaxID=1890364 RepID=A0A2P6MUV5_9EUKA|nr:protein-S-isoprenylcysteine O-methyltransferase [Planoprotostelium fungivorum]
MHHPKYARLGLNPRSVPLNTIVLFALGAIWGLGFSTFWTSDSFYDVAIYFSGLTFCHFWEYLYVALFQPSELSFDSFLLYQSNEFVIALAVAWAEYILERLLFPSMKSYGPLVYIGQVLRTTSMYTAGSNFHHQVRDTRDEKHKLVTKGIYSVMRHPSYCGWFWYSVGGQLVLSNPICLVAYVYVLWNFFNDRIQDEEASLISFFGKDYIEYKKRTISGVPLI